MSSDAFPPPPSGSCSRGLRAELATGVPMEIVESYFSFLSPLDLISCSLVCDRWRHILMSNCCLVSKMRCYENVHDYPGAFDDDNPIVLKFMLFRNWDYFKRLQLYYNCSAFEKFETGSCLVSKMRCYENVHDYPGAFDDDNPIVLKFMLFRNWDYFKRLQLYYNCSAFEKFETASGIIQPSFRHTEMEEGWTGLKHFLINTNLFAIAISKKKDRLKLVRLNNSRSSREEDAVLADLSFASSCTGCATALIRDQIPLGLLHSFVYVYIMRPHPGVNVTLVSFDSDMSQYIRTDLTVSNLSLDRDLRQGIKFLQVNGLAVLHNFILFEVNCFNLTESRAVSYSMALKIKQVAAVPKLELVRVVQTEQYNLNVAYHAFDRKLFVLKCTHLKPTESLYEAVTTRHNEFKSVHVLETHTRELKYYAFWLNYLLYVDESRKRLHFWSLGGSQGLVRLNETVENRDIDAPLLSVVNGDILSVRTQLNYLFIHLSLGVTQILVYRLEEVSSRDQSQKTLTAYKVTDSDFTMNKPCKDVEVIGCCGKNLNVVLH